MGKRCQSLFAWKARQGIGNVLAELDARGCADHKYGLPQELPSFKKVLMDTSVRCAALDGWGPILECAQLAQKHPCNPEVDAIASRCHSMSVVDGPNQCYSRESVGVKATQGKLVTSKDGRAEPPHKWDKLVLTKSHVCGAKPCDGVTQYVVRSYLDRWGPPTKTETERCMISPQPPERSKLLVVVDKACNGCANTPSGSSNLWHRMTRMLTLWKALKAVACADYPGSCTDAPLPKADIVFTKSRELPNSSRTGWQTLAGGRLVAEQGKFIGKSTRWCSYEKMLLLPYAPAIMVNGFFFDPMSEKNPDQLWSLSFGRNLPCQGSEAGNIWRTFVRDMLLRMDLRNMLWPAHFLPKAERPDGTHVCLLLRTDPSKSAGSASSWKKSERSMPRHEAPGCVDGMHKTLKTVCHGREPLQPRNVLFRSGQSLREQVSQMAGCTVAMGIHGAQLMNVMWMPPGSAVVEYHRLTPTNGSSEMAYYYRNVASLSGHTYYSRQVCDTGRRQHEKKVYDYPYCAGYAKPDGVHMNMDDVRQMAIVAVASVGHAGGMYDDRPVGSCST